MITQPYELSASTLILPGVGSANNFMIKINDLGFDLSIREHAASGKKLIGICLGFQIMTKYSDEDDGTKCYLS